MPQINIHRITQAHMHNVSQAHMYGVRCIVSWILNVSGKTSMFPFQELLDSLCQDIGLLALQWHRHGGMRKISPRTALPAGRRTTAAALAPSTVSRGRRQTCKVIKVHEERPFSSNALDVRYLLGL